MKCTVCDYNAEKWTRTFYILFVSISISYFLDSLPLYPFSKAKGIRIMFFIILMFCFYRFVDEYW